MIEILKKSIEIAMASKHPSAPEFIKEVSQAIAEAEKDEPVAKVTGVYGGRFVVEPLNPAMVLPVNMALYTRPQPRKE
jgi:hypothetical protein